MLASSRGWVPLSLILLAGLLVTSCVSSGGGVRQAVVGRLAAAADEPEAAQVGRAVLLDGGNAVDAATAMALSMAVTLPSRVGLGGGGICLTHDPAEGVVRALDFMPEGTPGAGATPGLLRGLFALHAEYGRRRWEGLVNDAEHLARFGYPISRALATDLERAWPVLRSHPAAAARFGTAVGPLAEGDMLAQPELAGVLGQVRIGGVTGFYRGVLGDLVSDGYGANDLPLDVHRLQDIRPVWREPLRAEYGSDLISFAPGDAAGGALHLAAWQTLTEDNRFAEAVSAETRALLVSDALSLDSRPARGLASFGAGLAAQSSTGLAVVCGFTQNGLFGSGRYDEETGIFSVPAIDERIQRIAGLAMVTNAPRRLLMAGLSANGMAPALALPLAEIVLREQPITAALEAGRAVIDPTAAGLLVEDRLAVGAEGPFGGYASVTPVGAIGRALGIRCRYEGPSGCVARADRRGFGLGLSLER